MTYEDYIERAEDHLRKAEQAPSELLRQKHLGLTNAWLQMAKQADRHDSSFCLDDLRFALLRQELLGDHG